MGAAGDDLHTYGLGTGLLVRAAVTGRPTGLLGLVVASLAVAYLSTISTHLNWESSYVVSDFYRHFVNPEASNGRLVAVGRASPVGLMVLGAFFALQLDTALQGFQILLQIGAGTGLTLLVLPRLGIRSEGLGRGSQCDDPHGDRPAAQAMMSKLSWRRRGLSAPLSVALALAVASCTEDGVTGGARQSSGVVVTDSGGVTTVALGRVENLSPSQLTPTLVYSTLQNDLPLFRVTAAILLDGGGVALANSGSREVVLLAADGSLANRVGGHGEGPGEFGEITAMFKALDGFLVYDARMGRMNEFTDSGDFVTSWLFGSGSRIVDLKPLARGIDGETLAIVGDSRNFDTDGVRRDTTPLLMFAHPEDNPDTLSLLPAAELSYQAIPGGISTRFNVGFGRDVVAFGHEDRAIVGETGSLNLSVYRADGTRTRRIHGEGGGAMVSAGDVSAWRSEQLSEAAGLPPVFVEAVEKVPYNETFPAFETAVLGPGNMVWIALYARPADETRAWLVVGPDGQLRGRMDLPSGARVLAISADRFALLQRDELDVEDFRVYAY